MPAVALSTTPTTMVMMASAMMTLCDYGLVSELFRACFLLDLFENTHKGIYLFSHCPGTQKVDLAFSS
jgi:hypothetical protein